MAGRRQGGLPGSPPAGQSRRLTPRAETPRRQPPGGPGKCVYRLANRSCRRLMRNPVSETGDTLTVSRRLLK